MIASEPAVDLNSLLLWLVALSTITTVVRLVSHKGVAQRDWVWVSLGLLIVTGATWVWAPALAGYAGGGLWLLLVLVPALLSRLMFRATQQQKYARARRIAEVIYPLHPSPAVLWQVRFLRAMELAHRGLVAEAAALFAEKSLEDTAFGRTAKAQMLRLSGRWEELASFCSDRLYESDFEQDPGLTVLYLRALGETGNRTGLFEVFRRFERLFGQPGHAALRDVAWLYLFSFGGRREQVEAMLRGRLLPYPPAIKQFWTATSDLAAGRQETARRAFQLLLQDSDRMVRLNAEQRLLQENLHAPEPPDALSREQEELLGRIAKELDQEERYGMGASARPAARMTYAFIGACVAVFGLELVSGSGTGWRVLWDLGALSAPAVLEGETWRLFAFMFLHFGFLHLLMNMVALYVLGPFVEFSLGPVRFVVVYLVSGLSGGLLHLVLDQVAGPRLLVGASGCITGIAGATAAILLRGYYREKARVAIKRLLSVLSVIAIQVVYDLVTPQISFTAHTAGVVSGFVLASLMAHRVSRRNTAGPPAAAVEAARS